MTESVMRYIKFAENAKLTPPDHRGDAGYNLYAIEDALITGSITKVRTGIGVQFDAVVS